MDRFCPAITTHFGGGRGMKSKESMEYEQQQNKN